MLFAIAASALLRIHTLFFFACPKKNEKRAPANDIAQCMFVFLFAFANLLRRFQHLAWGETGRALI